MHLLRLWHVGALIWPVAILLVGAQKPALVCLRHGAGPWPLTATPEVTAQGALPVPSRYSLLQWNYCCLAWETELALAPGWDSVMAKAHVAAGLATEKAAEVPLQAVGAVMQAKASA